jgi:hypothetical protein
MYLLAAAGRLCVSEFALNLHHALAALRGLLSNDLARSLWQAPAQREAPGS